MKDDIVYQPTGEEVQFAKDWHGGQASMLYAIASTGSLSCARDDVEPQDLLHSLYVELKLIQHDLREGYLTYSQDSQDRPIVNKWVEKLIQMFKEQDEAEERALAENK